MRSTNAVYVITQAEYDKHKEKLKLVPCPHCRVVGCLIRHGYLKGHGDKANDEVRRGWRVFCSDRNLRDGCGRTYSILSAGFLYRRMVDAKRLWSLLRGIIEGLSRKAAWEKVSSPFCPDTGYRLWNAFCTSQTFIRSALLRAGATPKMKSPNSDLQVIEHLQYVFANAACPVSDFQTRFQTPFLNAHAPRINKSD
jgi:hypothetical protein